MKQSITGHQQGRDRQSNPHAKGCGAKGKRRIHLGRLGVRRAAQIRPIDIGTQVFAAHSAIGYTLDHRAALSRYLARSFDPLMHKHRLRADVPSELRLSAA